MNAPAALPPTCLPIPEDARVTAKWPPLMVEMAEYIGARPTLLLVDAHGGQQVYVPRDPARSPFVEAIGEGAAATIARIYGGERLELPVGRTPLAEARRVPVLASVRRGDMKVAAAARMLRMSRIAVSKLVNSPDDSGLPPDTRRRDTRQIELFDK